MQAGVSERLAEGEIAQRYVLRCFARRLSVKPNKCMGGTDMITVHEITGRKDLKEFMLFPNVLYKDNPYYVPDMLSSQVNDFLPDKNPAFEYCEAKCFLARKDGKIAGRIAAIYNTRANEKYKRNQMRFSHADYIDDDEVVDALFGAVENWALQKGCDDVHGPLGFSDLDREGLLVEGFERLSQFFVNYNAPYYPRQMERMGYAKDVDWVEFRITLPPKGVEDEGLQKLNRLATAVERRMKLKVAPLTNRNSIKPYVEKVFNLYNETYRILYGMVALTPGQVEKYVKEFLPIINARSTLILTNQNDDVVAFGVGAPSIALAQQKTGGRIFPFGWAHLLRAMNGKNDTWDMFLIAVHPDLQGKGVNAVILNRLLQQAISAGVRYAETGPELEENVDVQSQWRFFNAEQHKRRRAYIKSL